jgi:hypothetical protein
MLDLTTEKPIPLAAACRLIPPGRNGRQTHISTLLRWILSGVRGPGGTRVRLEAARLGSRWVTSREAIQRFSESLTPRLDAELSPSPRSPACRRRAAERAGQVLERARI